MMKRIKLKIKLILRIFVASFLLLSGRGYADTLTLSLQDVDLSVAMQMLSKHEKMNIFVANDVEGTVSVNIYNMETMDAIRSIAESAGYVAEVRANSVYIIKREDA